MAFRPKNLSAFHSAALWLAPMEMPPAASKRRMVCWITGVGAMPRSITFLPHANSAATTPSRIMTPLERGSRPPPLPWPAPDTGPNRKQNPATGPAVSPPPPAPRNPPRGWRGDLPAVPAIIRRASSARTPRARETSRHSLAARRCTCGSDPTPGSGRS